MGKGLFINTPLLRNASAQRGLPCQTIIDWTDLKQLVTQGQVWAWEVGEHEDRGDNLREGNKIQEEKPTEEKRKYLREREGVLDFKYSDLKIWTNILRCFFFFLFF